MLKQAGAFPTCGIDLPNLLKNTLGRAKDPKYDRYEAKNTFWRVHPLTRLALLWGPLLGSSCDAVDHPTRTSPPVGLAKIRISRYHFGEKEKERERERQRMIEQMGTTGRRMVPRGMEGGLGGGGENETWKRTPNGLVGSCLSQST